MNIKSAIAKLKLNSAKLELIAGALITCIALALMTASIEGYAQKLADTSFIDTNQEEQQ